jgi:SpoVK/Ycf46/Vps4 family AAA+-type ATPase
VFFLFGHNKTKIYVNQLEKDTGITIKTKPDDDYDDLAEKMMNALRKASKKAIKLSQENLFISLDNFIDYLSPQADKSDLPTKLHNLSELLGLSQVEEVLAKFLLVKSELRDFEEYFLRSKIFHIFNRSHLMTLLDANNEDIQKALKGTLFSLEIVRGCERGDFEVGDIFYTLLETPSGLESIENFVIAKKPVLRLDNFFFPKEKVNLITGLLQNKPTSSSTHILLYGEPGTGKTQFARTITDAMGVPSFEVNPANSLNSHRTHLIVAERFCRINKEGILIVDEADKLLNVGELTSFFSLFQTDTSLENSKSWLDTFLVNPGGRTIWIVNNISNIPSSVIRRFTFSLNFKKLGRKERTYIWKTTREDLLSIGSDILSDEALEKLAYERDISPGVINQSLKKALEAGPKDELTLVSYINKIIDAHHELSQTRDKFKTFPKFYRVEALATNPPISEIIEVLKYWAQENLGVDPEKREGIKLLFYGIPGTGKTELAHFLAKELDLELFPGRLSQILDRYVGESEKNLRKLFNEASATGGIVLIDEVESFLLNRDKIKQEHNLMLINEFLTCLANFTGIFIGSTNRIHDLDPAAIRRFVFRVEFLPVKPSGRVILYESFLLPFTGTPLSEEEKKVLFSIPSLTPADFSNSATRVRWSEQKVWDNLSVLEVLKEEKSLHQMNNSPQTKDKDELKKLN